jgi:hypothetical protein
VRQHQHSRGLARELELVELPVVAQGLGVQLLEHGIERVLHRAGVAPGGCGRHLVALVQVHASPGLREESGGRTTDDAAADDGDVGGSAHSPLA